MRQSVSHIYFIIVRKLFFKNYKQNINELQKLITKNMLAKNFRY